MKILHARLAVAVLLFLFLTMSNYGGAQRSEQASESAKHKTNEGLVARGKYIVEGVAMCGMCHTPRDSSGNLDRTRWLEGASVWLQPAQPVEDWPQRAPRIAGSPPGSDAELTTLLTTGLWRGTRLRPPMPQFRMSNEDAESVVAYLRSLNPGPGN